RARLPFVRCVGESSGITKRGPKGNGTGLMAPVNWTRRVVQLLVHLDHLRSVKGDNGLATSLLVSHFVAGPVQNLRLRYSRGSGQIEQHHRRLGLKTGRLRTPLSIVMEMRRHSERHCDIARLLIGAGAKLDTKELSSCDSPDLLQVFLTAE